MKICSFFVYKGCNGVFSVPSGDVRGRPFPSVPLYDLGNRLAWAARRTAKFEARHVEKTVGT